jgi:putative peptidoglycan lipid II flippase
MVKSFLISALVLNVALMLGRISGFFREILVANVFGLSADADVVVLLLTVPDFLVGILAGGALSAVLIPEFSKNPGAAKKLAWQMTILLFIVFGVVAVLLAVNAEWFVSVLAPGFDNVKMNRAAGYLAPILVLVPISIASGVLVAFLHSKNRFGIAGLTTLIFNSCIIIGLLLMMLEKKQSLFVLSLSVCFAILVRYATQFFASNIKLEKGAFSKNLISTTLIKKYFQVMIAGSIFYLYPVITRIFFSYQESGSVALFNYAIKLIELPLLICITFISIILLPRLASTHLDNRKEHSLLIEYGFQVSLVLSLVASVILIVGVDTYVQLVYGLAFKSNELGSIINLVEIGLVSLIFQGLTLFITSIHNSRGNTLIPLQVSGLALTYLIAVLYSTKGEQTNDLLMSIVVSAYIISALLSVISLWSANKVMRSIKKYKFFYGAVFTLSLCLICTLSNILVLNIPLFAKVIVMTISGLIFLIGIFFSHQDARHKVFEFIRRE